MQEEQKEELSYQLNQYRSLKGRKNFYFDNKTKHVIAKKSFIFISRKSNFPGLQLGIICSAKMGKAVKRNKVRRFIRESVRQLLMCQDKHINRDAIIILKKHSFEISKKQLLSDLNNMLARI